MQSSCATESGRLGRPQVLAGSDPLWLEFEVGFAGVEGPNPNTKIFFVKISPPPAQNEARGEGKNRVFI